MSRNSNTWRVCAGLKSLEHPSLTADNWRVTQPCRELRFGSRTVVLTQPSSSFFVYLLGLQSIWVAFAFWQNANGQTSRYWWSASMLLWGVGAMLAGTSYQAFGYHIKCADRDKTLWTSWWEIVYLMLQHLSMSFLLVAVAWSSTVDVLRSVLIMGAMLSGCIYVAMTLWGALKPIRSWLTFERMLFASLPAFGGLVILSGTRYLQTGNSQDLVLLVSWFGLWGCWLAYWVYDRLGYTERLWANGIWFSQNDVLHLTLIAWFFWIRWGVLHWIQDYSGLDR